MSSPARQSGVFLLLVLLLAVLAVAALFAAVAGDVAATRERVTERALAQAREALIAYAADRPINSAVGPGYLPCPDLDGDGWAESTCGSLDGSTGQEQRIGRLPWKTLGLAPLADGDGELLWYAVSAKYKGLLNCAASRGCVDMSPAAALGAITVRDASGRPFHDGTLADVRRAEAGGAVAVVIAPGSALERLQADGSRAMQRRDCEPGACDADGRCLADPPQHAARCDPANYLDRAPSGEDNAAFLDRDGTGRALDGDGFIAGPVTDALGRTWVNDRILALGYGDVMRAVLRRVALEVLHCLRYYATRPENAARYPWPAPSCTRQPPGAGAPDSAGSILGTVPDTPFQRTADSSAGALLTRWWRAEPRVPEALDELPTALDACRIAVAPGDAEGARSSPPGTPADEGASAALAGNAWWSTWQPYVSYALAPGYSPAAPGQASCAAGACLALDATSGSALARDAQVAVIASSRCEAAPRCDPVAGCTHIVVDDGGADLHGIATYP